MMGQLENTNLTRMEHVLLSNIYIGSEEPTISRAHLEETIIQTNQASASIGRRRHVDRGLSSGSQKICDKIIIDFGRNMNNGIPMNPSRTIGRITPHTASLGSGTGIGWNINDGRNSGDRIPPGNIGSLGIFER